MIFSLYGSKTQSVVSFEPSFTTIILLKLLLSKFSTVSAITFSSLYAAITKAISQSIIFLNHDTVSFAFAYTHGVPVNCSATKNGCERNF